ncbi:hypothetical protein MMC08_003974 [Hypocenomyce scalaris]|nr:hypothetical protein [Hypocenomyce scalaris]
MGSLSFPENFSAERPPILNETICGCKCGCAGCVCYNASEGDAITSWRSDEDERSEVYFEHLSNGIHDLRLLDNEHREGYGGILSGLPQDAPYWTYMVESNPGFDVIADAEATTSQTLHDQLADHSEQHFFLRETEGLLYSPWFLVDFLDPRPSTPGAESTMDNPSTGEHSPMSSITSSMHLIRSRSPDYLTRHAGAGFQAFPYNFTTMPLELMMPQNRAHCCAHGSRCPESSLAQDMLEGVRWGYSEDDEGARSE